MGFDLANLAANDAVIEVEFLGQTTKVTYHPAVVTQDNLIAAQDAKNDDSFVDFFVSLVADWDVTRARKKVPLTVKELRSVPLVFLRAIFMAIMEEAGSGEAVRPSNAG